MADQQMLFWTLVLLPLAGILVTSILYVRTRGFLARAVHTRGTVRHMTIEESEQRRGDGQGTETITTYTAHIEFTPEGGSTVAFSSSNFHERPIVGNRVKVAYDPARPQASARIDDVSVWTPVMISGCLTILVLLFSVFSVWSLAGQE